MILQLLAQSHILLLNSFFNTNLKYSPQQRIFNMPTEMFFLQNINGYNDTMETFEGQARITQDIVDKVSFGGITLKL